MAPPKLKVLNPAFVSVLDDMPIGDHAFKSSSMYSNEALTNYIKANTKVKNEPPKIEVNKGIVLCRPGYFSLDDVILTNPIFKDITGGSAEDAFTQGVEYVKTRVQSKTLKPGLLVFRTLIVWSNGTCDLQQVFTKEIKAPQESPLCVQHPEFMNIYAKTNNLK